MSVERFASVARRQNPSLPVLLLHAEPIAREGLSRWLTQDPAVAQVVVAVEAGMPAPRLVIWALDGPMPTDTFTQELQALQERWQPAPLLIVLPARHGYNPKFLLTLPVQGLLVCPQSGPLREAVTTLLAGGRLLDTVATLEASPADAAGAAVPLGLGQWLLTSGLQQIDADLRRLEALQAEAAISPLVRMLLRGRQRELRMARQLLLWLWGPIAMAWSDGGSWPLPLAARSIPRAEASAAGGVSLTLRQRTAEGIWEALRQRLLEAASGGPRNGSGLVMALDALQADRRRDLLMALLEQFALLRGQLQSDNLNLDSLINHWRQGQAELRRQALSRMAGSYVQLPWEGGLRPVAGTLAATAELALDDPELPDPRPMLATLFLARPLLVEGRLLPPDEPQAVLHLEMLLANWLVRSAELVSAEVLAACADWPELRRYLLQPDYLPTRNLERLRNRLNAQQRWMEWFERPVRLYESRRPLYRLEGGSIQRVDLTEPRDAELRRLPWPQQLVTLILEARDALAPQLQNLMRSLGDLVVVLLTRVVGRAIGLVGRGILQGMGRGVGQG